MKTWSGSSPSEDQGYWSCIISDRHQRILNVVDKEIRVCSCPSSMVHAAFHVQLLYGMWEQGADIRSTWLFNTTLSIITDGRFNPCSDRLVTCQPNLVRNYFESVAHAKPIKCTTLRWRALLRACEKFCGASESSPSYYTNGWLISAHQFLVIPSSSPWLWAIVDACCSY
jgi:hypothetical protein